MPQNGTCKGKAEGAVPLGGQQLERFDPKGHRVEVGNKVNELASPAQGEGKDGEASGSRRQCCPQEKAESEAFRQALERADA